MKNRIDYLLIDLRNLYSASDEDYQRERWASYCDYIREYNRLAKIASGIVDLRSDELDCIQQVPMLKRAVFGVGSSDEQAKLREVVNKTKRLIDRLELERGK